MPLPLKDFPRSGEDVAQRQKGDKVSPKVTERAHPAPLRGAAAAAAEGPSNRRSAKKVQRRRPPPAADAGRSCWGSGLQDASAAQGTKQTQGAATRPAPARRNRRALAALNTRHLLCKPVCGLKAPLGLSCPPGTAVLSGSLLSVKREHLRPAKHHPKCTLIANQKCRLFAFQREKPAFLFFARKLCKKP